MSPSHVKYLAGKFKCYIDSRLTRHDKTEDVAKFFDQTKWEHSLPIDIAKQILDYLLDLMNYETASIATMQAVVQPTLRALTLTCRDWCNIATPRLYRHIYISTTAELDALSWTLQNTKYQELRTFVRSFLFSGTLFKSGHLGYAREDVHNLRSVYSSCPHLHALSLDSPPKVFGPMDAFSEQPHSLSNVVTWANVTRLEIAFPDGVPCTGGSYIFSKSFILPSLQELFLDLKFKEFTDPEVVSGGVSIEWPELPRLRRLNMTNCFGSCLRFPENAPSLQVLELLKCTSFRLDEVFDRLRLNTLNQTLESIAITTLTVFVQPERVIDLRSFKSLKELCIPFDYPMILRGDAPDSLEKMVLGGRSLVRDSWNDAYTGMLLIGLKISSYLDQKKSDQMMKNLKEIHVYLNVDLQDEGTWWTIVQGVASDANVNLSVGNQDYVVWKKNCSSKHLYLGVPALCDVPRI